MSAPRGVQRKRAKGWKMPANTKSVCRPGRFGNPFVVEPDPVKRRLIPGGVADAETAVALFEQIVRTDPVRCDLIRRELRGYNLACYCPLSSPCHRNVLLRIANE